MSKQRIYGWVCAAAVVLMSPMMALARQTEEHEVIDARLEGYDKTVVSLPASGTALMWLLLLVLIGITMAVMFKDAKRSHLD